MSDIDAVRAAAKFIQEMQTHTEGFVKLVREFLFKATINVAPEDATLEERVLAASKALDEFGAHCRTALALIHTSYEEELAMRLQREGLIQTAADDGAVALRLFNAVEALTDPEDEFPGIAVGPERDELKAAFEAFRDACTRTHAGPPEQTDAAKKQSLREAVVPMLAAVGFEEIPADYPDFQDEVVIATSQKKCILVEHRDHFSVAYYGPILVQRPDGSLEPHPTSYEYITERVDSEAAAREVVSKHVATCRRVISELFLAAGFNKEEDSMGGKAPLFDRCAADKDGCLFRIQAQARRPGPGGALINTTDSCFIGDIASAQQAVAHYEAWVAWRKAEGHG